MKFRITRTSNYGVEKTPPCAGAKFEDVDGSAMWTIEVETLDDLLAICRETNEAVIVDPSEIEIYDSYRE